MRPKDDFSRRSVSTSAPAECRRTRYRGSTAGTPPPRCRWPGAAAVTGVIGRLFWLFANRNRAILDQFKRGAIVIDDPGVKRDTAKVKRQHGAAILSLAGIWVHPDDDTKHFKLMGTTGSGKSTAIRELIDQAIRRGDRAVIADADDGYLSNFYDAARGDVILNPFDDRSVKWDLFAEIGARYDVDQRSPGR